ncbi:unnamed protein product [Citrullus colocynthis]|uniref:Uncharacterized protein n=1 Tax=Citrullus colocynthis TaxID=252529 RepID=A0ABP0Z8E2_9ROSI
MDDVALLDFSEPHHGSVNCCVSLSTGPGFSQESGPMPWALVYGSWLSKSTGPEAEWLWKERKKKCNDPIEKRRSKWKLIPANLRCEFRGNLQRRRVVAKPSQEIWQTLED